MIYRGNVYLFIFISTLNVYKIIIRSNLNETLKIFEIIFFKYFDTRKFRIPNRISKT